MDDGTIHHIVRSQTVGMAKVDDACVVELAQLHWKPSYSLISKRYRVRDPPRWRHEPHRKARLN
jgi:hypothetical protein